MRLRFPASRTAACAIFLSQLARTSSGECRTGVSRVTAVTEIPTNHRTAFLRDVSAALRYHNRFHQRGESMVMTRRAVRPFHSLMGTLLP